MAHSSKINPCILEIQLVQLGFEKISKPACETGLDYDFFYYQKELINGFTLISSQNNADKNSTFFVQLIDLPGEIIVNNFDILNKLVLLFGYIKLKNT